VKRARQLARTEAHLLEIIADAQDARYGSGDLTPWELPIVVACRRVLADTIAQFPMVAMTNGQPRDPQPAIVVRPDPSEPAWLTKARIVDNLTRAGHAWLMPTGWAADGWPNALRVIDGDRGAPSFDIDGRIIDVSIGGERFGIGPDRGEVIWMPYQVPRSGSVGDPPCKDC